jgi:transcriptional regulator with XRE-family HTH domain
MRQKLELSQKDLARELGTSQNAIYRLESPKAVRPNISTLERLAEFFDVGLVVRFAPFSEIADWTLNMQPETIEVPNFEDDLGFTERKEPALAGISTTNTYDLTIAAGGTNGGASLESLGNNRAVQALLSSSPAAAAEAGPLERMQSTSIPTGTGQKPLSDLAIGASAGVVYIDSHRPKGEGRRMLRKYLGRRRRVHA